MAEQTDPRAVTVQLHVGDGVYVVSLPHRPDLGEEPQMSDADKAKFKRIHDEQAAAVRSVAKPANVPASPALQAKE